MLAVSHWRVLGFPVAFEIQFWFILALLLIFGLVLLLLLPVRCSASFETCNEVFACKRQTAGKMWYVVIPAILWRLRMQLLFFFLFTFFLPLRFT